MKRRILFVDDEPLVLQGLQRMLRAFRDEWEMLFVGTGAEALTQRLKAAGLKLLLVSGGFTYFTDRIRERLQFDYARSKSRRGLATNRGFRRVGNDNFVQAF